MKRYLLLIISIVCLAASAQEQAHSSRRPRMTSEEFQTKQKEFIARHAELTEEESSAFFPLYFELQDKKFVYRVIEGKTSQTEISVAPLDDGKSYIVEDGLNEGDIIIAEGAGLIKEGTVIKTKETSAQEAE